jgi:hypothetical protein
VTNAATAPTRTVHSAASEVIASNICNALIQIQTTHPDWIQTKIRHISLSDKRARIIRKLMMVLDSSLDTHEQGIQVTLFIGKLLDPVFLGTQSYQRLNQFIRQQILAHAPLTEPSSPSSTASVPENIGNASVKESFRSKSIAVLLLDAENIDLVKAAESWLASFCKHPISLKFAFGNWKKLGDRDKDLHQRGYHLIHVPEGKNHADSKMMIIGSSIFVHFPNIKEAIVCSNDSDLENLQSSLHFQGLDVHLLERHQQELKLTTFETGTTAIFKLSHSKRMPSKKIGTQFCQEYLKRSSEGHILLSQLSSEFSKEFGFSINTFVKHYGLGRSAKVFFQTSSSFSVSIGQNKTQTYVALASRHRKDGDPLHDFPGQSPGSFTVKGLQIVSLGIVKRLIRDNSDQAISVGIFASTFRQQHDRPIKSVLKELGLNSSVPTFLQTCDSVQLEKVEKGWMITLVKKTPTSTSA